MTVFSFVTSLVTVEAGSWIVSVTLTVTVADEAEGAELCSGTVATEVVG